MGDEPSRKRGAAQQLTQDNWDRDEEDPIDPDQEGEFKKASEAELSKRRIVKVRRGGAAVPDGVAADPADAKPAATFSWTTPAPAAKDDQKEGEAKDGAKKDNGDQQDAASQDKAAAKEANGTDGEKKPAFTFGGFGGGSGFSFGGASGSGFSSGSSFSFGGASGTGSGFSFGTGGASGSSFSFGSGTKLASFTSVGTQGWSQKKEEGEEGESAEAGDGEDVEKEVTVKKSDAIVQLEEVETTTGEEGEKCVFQCRAKLFTLGAAVKETKEGEEAAPDKEEKKEDKAGGEGKMTWNVTGVGNIKVNVPKEDCADKSKRARIVMRRQKTFQVCLNTYLFASMVCDKAGPKDVRFTGMKNGSETELATYLLHVKEEEQADEFVSLVNKHKATGGGEDK